MRRSTGLNEEKRGEKFKFIEAKERNKERALPRNAARISDDRGVGEVMVVVMDGGRWRWWWWMMAVTPEGKVMVV